MKLTREMVVRVELTQAERDAINTTMELLYSLHNVSENYDELIGVETGEIIECDEINRTLGILSGVDFNKSWKVE